ncbi:MAG: flagellar hook-basal body complex protein FliE [Deltaproteobacteria bacterium]|nr:flagellar hook-basal body complex protein FliE [Deltaproteobacteria bacterium]
MEDLKIKNISFPALEKISQGQRTASDPLAGFKKAIKNSVEEVNSLQKEANLNVQEMIQGKQDIHQTMISMEQAGLSFRLMLQVRNKMIAAYEEIMRMQF